MHEHDEQDTLAIFNKDAVCTYVSPSCEKVTGIPQDQYMGSNWFDWTHPDDRDYCREKYDVHLSQATTKTEFSCRLINRAGVINHIHFAVSGAVGPCVMSGSDLISAVSERIRPCCASLVACVCRVFGRGGTDLRGGVLKSEH